MPPARVHVHPDRVDIVTGSGCSSIAFGSIFVLVGVFALLFVINSAEHAVHHSILERVLAGAIGLAFILVGTLFGFSRNGVTVDGTNSVTTKWIGLFYAKYETEKYPFGDFNRYAIAPEGPGTYAVVMQGGTTTVTLLTSPSYETALEHAEKIGSLLPLELHDEVQGQH